MVKVKKLLRFPLVLVSLCTLAATAQTPLPGPLPPDMLVSIQYVLTGVNGGYPVQTLTVSGTLPGLGVGYGEAVVTTAGFNSTTTKRLPLTDAELRALVKIFADNGFSTMDSVFRSGCLACPDFSITYGKKTVRGNTTGGSAGLANIKAGLDALVKKVNDGTSVATSRDTVVFEPAKPTNLDNITFKLFNFSNCCVTKYYKQAVTVTDTAIYLSYEYDDSACAYTRCLVPGSWASFLSKPIPAGKYSVYKVANIYCPPPRICPLSIVGPQYVGPLVVLKSPPPVDRRDTVIFEPAKPTNLDNITFKLFNYNNCCATKYYKQTVTVGDTAIYLSYEYDDSACAYTLCLVPGSWASFLSKPIRAGKYSVYKVGNIYCPPPRICPLFIAMPQYVGPLVVLKSTPVQSLHAQPAMPQGPRIIIHGTDVRLVLDHSDNIAIRAFGLDGSLLGTIFKGFRPQGTSRYSLGSVATGAGGAMIVTLTTESGTISRTVFGLSIK